MAENVWMACTNLGGLVAVYRMWVARRPLGALLFFGAMSSSFVYHLCETKKHRLPGIGVCNTWKWHRILINADRLFAVLSVMYGVCVADMGWIYMHAPIGVLSLVMLAISEYHPQNKWLYMVTHSVWHVAAFWLASQLAIDV